MEEETRQIKLITGRESVELRHLLVVFKIFSTIFNSRSLRTEIFARILVILHLYKYDITGKYFAKHVTVKITVQLDCFVGYVLAPSYA